MIETMKEKTRRLEGVVKGKNAGKTDTFVFSEVRKILELAIAEEREVNTPKWIEVNESLPDSDEQVLVCTPSGVSYGYLDGGDDEGWVWILFQNADGEHNYDEPTHWMRTPLPATPKDEVSDE